MPDPLVRLADWIKRRFFRLKQDPGERKAQAYYGTVYLECIRGALASLGDGPFRILCAGCGTGRIAVPLAVDGHEVTGIDVYRDALRIAARNAERAGVSLRLVDSELLDAASSVPGASFDAVLGIESMYMHRDLPAVVRGLAALVRPGGLFIGTHRTRFYSVLYCLANGRFEEALAVVNGNSGRLTKGAVRFFYNWQTAGEVEALYADADLSILERHAIGPYSGFGYDPLSAVCDPGTLDPAQLEALRRIEMTADPDNATAARYMLVVARRGPAATPE